MRKPKWIKLYASRLCSDIKVGMLLQVNSPEPSQVRVRRIKGRFIYVEQVQPK